MDLVEVLRMNGLVKKGLGANENGGFEDLQSNEQIRGYSTGESCIETTDG